MKVKIFSKTFPRIKSLHTGDVNMKFRDLKLVAAALAIGLLGPGQTGCATKSQSSEPEILQDRFARMDVNGDGKIVMEEFSSANPNMSDQAFVIIDKNGDKQIDRVEWLEFTANHGRPGREKGAPMNNIPGDPLIPPPDSSDLPLMRPPVN